MGAICEHPSRIARAITTNQLTSPARNRVFASIASYPSSPLSTLALYAFATSGFVFSP